MKNHFTALLYGTALLLSFNAYSIPKLNSFPSASATIFLDFDGHYVSSSVWNGGNPFTCVASGMTDIQITETFNRVSEDYRPFNINITTDSTIFLAAPLTKRVRIIITPTSAWFPGVGGVAQIGSFTWGDDTPAFVFADRLPVGGPIRPKMIAECCSHESGHTLNLSHQSKYDAGCTLLETYSTGFGSGQSAWSPVMGNSYYKNMTGWNDGPTPNGCSITQDNLTIVTTLNGFTYRPDDYAEVLNGTTFSLPASNFSVNGIISTTSDKDAFKVTMVQNSNFFLNAVPYNIGINNEAANLDIKLFLYNSTGNLIRTYDPISTMNAIIDTVLNQGTYYIKVDGTGNANVSEYGSLGAYTVNGSGGPLPIHYVSLAGKTDKNKHDLSWTIIADEAIRNIEVEISADGSSFNSLTTVVPTAKNFSYLPYNSNLLYYRLKVTSVVNQIVYSNIIALRGSGITDKLFSVSTLVQHDITVNASENFQYRLSDANGRILNNGKGLKGFNKIPISNMPAGLYFISIYSNNQVQTERIIKQ